MNCQRAKSLLPLCVGGDLDPTSAEQLEVHLQSCSRCAAELTTLQRTQTFLKEQASSAVEDFSPQAFAWQLEERISESERVSPVAASPRRIPQWKIALSLGALAAALLLAVFLAPQRPLSKGGRSLVHWQKLEDHFGERVKGPIPLESWNPLSEAGVFLVMHKPDPHERPDLFAVDYCGESEHLSGYRSYPWIHSREKKLLARAGSEDNVFIAVYPMPGASKRDRRSMESRFIEICDPFFNRKEGA